MSNAQIYSRIGIRNGFCFAHNNGFHEVRPTFLNTYGKWYSWWNALHVKPRTSGVAIFGDLDPSLWFKHDYGAGEKRIVRRENRSTSVPIGVVENVCGRIICEPKGNVVEPKNNERRKTTDFAPCAREKMANCN